MKIDYISNFELADNSGGWNGINFKLFESLTRLVPMSYFGGISPPVLTTEKIISKTLRSFGKAGNFFFFSESRLLRINRILEEQEFSGDLQFFFGATPWIKYKPAKPYVVYLDICFPHYLKIFLKSQKFRKKDVDRITLLERNFLENAKYVFWGSNWAMCEAKKYFGNLFDHSHVISTGGHIEIPVSIDDQPKQNLLFVSLNFYKKGGLIAYKTFTALKKEFCDLTFTIIGEKPSEEIINTPGVRYLGVLRKDMEEHVSIFKKELASSFFLIHPTEMDTMGAVIAEAGYYGLPTIASKNFGIPDLIKNGETGVLVELPLNESQFIEQLRYLLKDTIRYNSMRQAARKFMVSERSWPAISTRILEILSK